jgi:ferric iron reductase protein FhuF
MRAATGLVAQTLAPGAALEIAGERPYGLAPEGAPGFRPALEHLRDAAALRRQLDEGRAELGVRRPDIAATFVAQLHTWALTAPVAAALLATGRAPVLAPASVAVARARGTRAPAFGLHGTTIAVLPGDVAAGAPETCTVADRDALVGVLWTAVAAHLELLVPALRQASGRPERALWRVGHDAVAIAITGLGELWNARAAAWALWEEASRLAPAPLAGGARPVLVDVEGSEEMMLERAGCCLAYRCPAFPQPCVGCPLTPAAERPARLAAARRQRPAAMG